MLNILYNVTLNNYKRKMWLNSRDTWRLTKSGNQTEKDNEWRCLQSASDLISIHPVVGVDFIHVALYGSLCAVLVYEYGVLSF